MIKRTVLPVVFLFLMLLPAFSQVGMGKWRTHLAYNSVNQIAQSPNKIFAVSDGALFSVDKTDGGMEFYSKVTGLNDASISRIGYDEVTNQLLIVYANGNIDVLTGGGVVNIPDLYNKQMSSAKDVNQIIFYNGRAYLSCSFGILVLNMKKKEVADTYFIGPNGSQLNVLNTVIFNNNIYSLTSSTLFQADINNTNLVNYGFWSQVNGLPGSGDFQMITAFNGSLYLLRGGKMYQQQADNSWIPFRPELNVSGFKVTNNRMSIFTNDNIWFVDNSLNITSSGNIGTVSDAEYDSQSGIFWLAAGTQGVISFTPTAGGTPTLSYFKPDGPAVNIPWSMTFAGDKLFVVPGGRWSAQYLRDGAIMMYQNGKWKNIVASSVSKVTGYMFKDLMNVAVDPANNSHFFVTAYGEGLYEFRDTTLVRWYTNTNSTLETIIPSSPLDYIRTDGAVFDANRNLYLTNSSVTDGIQLLTADSTWHKLGYPGARLVPTLGTILISNQNPNQKWVASVRSTPGIFVFDDNGTPTDMTDDKSIFISSFVYTETDKNNNTVLVSIQPSAIYCLAQDKNGVIWAGTEQGPILFNNPANVFNSDFTCSRVKIPRNDNSGLADYLLANVKVKAIAIDGANRKWIGTEGSGVYLMSENGQQTIHHFTTSNSPLLSDDVLSIAINPKTGEVYFGTAQGLISYQSDAAEASASFVDVHAYPNPVRPNFSGVITITGLIADTQVKITDINGNLVCQTVSNGSIATWDGKDIHGKRVNTGVYLAICVSPDGTQSTITKILFIN